MCAAAVRVAGDTVRFSCARARVPHGTEPAQTTATWSKNPYATFVNNVCTTWAHGRPVPVPRWNERATLVGRTAAADLVACSERVPTALFRAKYVAIVKTSKRAKRFVFVSGFAHAVDLLLRYCSFNDITMILNVLRVTNRNYREKTD